jgi:hypothetical protein
MKKPKPLQPYHRTAYYPNTIDPDGLIIFLDLDNFEVGMSMFIPALNLAEAKRQVKMLAKDKDWKVAFADRIEGSRLGIRFWRLL